MKWIYYERRAHPLDDLARVDSASRGEWGSLTFLTLIRWRAKAAGLGALLTILALGIDPFAQQAVTFYDKRVNTTAMNAFIPRTSIFDFGTTSEATSNTILRELPIA